jgi:hypothetical protein
LFGAYPNPFPGYGGTYERNDPLYSHFYPEYPQTMGMGGGFYESPMMTVEGESERLKGQAESIRREIDQIKNRISELEKE